MSYVTAIQHGTVVIHGVDSRLDEQLSDLSPRHDGEGLLILSVANSAELPTVLARLRDLGVAFMGAPQGWPPAEMFADLRDKGLISGTFDELVFSGPKTMHRRTR
jgi:hypothetical protein